MGNLGGSLDYFSSDTLYEQDGVRLLSEAIITNKDHDTSLLLEFENTASEQVNVVLGQVALNGLIVQSGNCASSTINPGKRCVMGVHLTSNTYQNIYGIEEIGNITFTVALKNMDYNAIREAEAVGIAVSDVQGAFDAEGSELYAENGIHVVFKGLAPDSSSYSDDIHTLLLVENGTDQEISVSIEHDSLFVNGFITDFYGDIISIPSKCSATFAVDIQGRSLEKNRIDGIDAIEEVEMQLEFRDANYNEISTPTITAAIVQ